MAENAAIETWLVDTEMDDALFVSVCSSATTVTVIERLPPTFSCSSEYPRKTIPRTAHEKLRCCYGQ